MKISIAIAIVISIFMLAPSAQAQHAKKHYMRRSTMTTDTTAMQSTESGSVGAEVSGITGSAPGDPYNLNHPFFQGTERWSNADTLYKHGDFPWALVSQHPEDFRFNASTGQWEISNTANLGKTK